MLYRPDVSSTGIETSLWWLSRALISEGCKVHIIYDKSFNPDTPSDIIVDKVHLTGVGGPSVFPFNRIPSFRRSAIKVLEKFLTEYNIDVFTFHGAYSLILASLFRKITDIPLIYHTYDAQPSEAITYLFKITGSRSIQYFLRTLLKYSFYTLVEYYGIKNVDLIITSSPANIVSYQKYYRCSREMIYALPTGGDQLSHYTPNSPFSVVKKIGISEEAKKILFIGTDWHRKGVRYLLLAFKEVLSNLSENVYLIVVGPPQEPFITMIRRFGIGRQIIITGYVSKETLASLYATCDIFVLPSLHEGWANTVTEAICFGKPVITTPIGGYPVIKNEWNGLIVPPKDHKSLANAITKLLKDESLYKQMCANASLKAKELSWKNIARMAMNIYQEIIERKRVI